MHGRKKVGALVAALALVGAACGSAPGASSGAQRRTVQVDYIHDEFATSMFDYFPRRVEVRQGDTVEFKQAWAGEPHSVTMGTLVDEKIAPVLRLLQEIERTGKLPEDEPTEFETFFRALPFAFGDDDMAQNAAQPCYVEEAEFTGTYPGDGTTPCPKRPQPAFTGRQPVYSSGIIPFEGVQGNTFRVRMADDAQPGTYSFYCNVHGPLQWGQVVVKEKGAPIPSSDEVARQARREAERKVAPMLRNWQAAKAGKAVEGGDPAEPTRIDAKGKNLVGVPTPFFEDNTFVHGVVNEFVPRDVTAKVGQKVSWTFVSGHTLSFNVPKYFPVFTIAEDGKVSYNKRAEEPQGWPAPPEEDREAPPGAEEGDSAHAEEAGGGGESAQPPPDEPAHIDVGSWDGKGFRSTGLKFEDNDTLTVTFTRPGTFAFACLVHPQMVGKLVVKP